MIAMTAGYEVGGDMRDDYRIYSYSGEVIKVGVCVYICMCTT